MEDFLGWGDQAKLFLLDVYWACGYVSSILPFLQKIYQKLV
jgi:hypothetical protein